MSLITAQKMAEDILKMMNDVASEYPKEEREELRAVLLGQLGLAMFNGPAAIDDEEKNSA